MYMGLLFGAITTSGYGNEVEGVFSYRVGQLEVFMLVESERDGSTGILPGASDDILRRYIPAEGFKHSANAFLIKAPGQNTLIDTGTGTGGILLDKIKLLGVEPENINAVIITHLHGDHFGSLQRDGRAVFPNAKIYLSARELEYFTVTNVNQGAVNALAPYRSASRIVTFEPGVLAALTAGQRLPEIIPGITAIAAYGHTSGHTIFQIENSGAKFLIIGDLLHIALVQFPVPEISASYDMDQTAAAQIRRQVLAYAAANSVPVGGMHIVYPAAGVVEVDGSGFKFTPFMR
jgi:glyoxylase-like metal-dependent hydrolase (beta-lactamase superfamily II)